MANTIRIKRSTGSSNPTSLENAEIAFREGDEVLVIGKGTGGSGGSATSIEAIGGKGAFFDKATTRNANIVLAGPTTGSAAAPTFRSLVVADVPTLTSAKLSDFDTQVRTSRLDQMTAPSAAVSLNSQKITNLADPTADADAANKGYVDGVAQGLDVKDSVKATTTANGTLASAFANGQTIDGITLATNDRILIKDQSTQTENGIYTVNASGAPTRADGLQKTGNTISVDLKANGGLVIESSEVAVDLAASSITGTLAIGDGGTGATSASAARTALGVAIGSDVQAFDAQLSDIAGLTPTDSNFIVGDGSNFVLESGATARASLGAQASAADLTNLSSCQSGGSAALAALTSTEIGILDGATVTTAELNIMDGDTSATSTTLAAADRLVMNDAGTMKQVALSDLVTFLEDESASSFNIDGGTY
jgi:hypothetical protein